LNDGKLAGGERREKKENFVMDFLLLTICFNGFRRFAVLPPRTSPSRRIAGRRKLRTPCLPAVNGKLHWKRRGGSIREKKTKSNINQQTCIRAIQNPLEVFARNYVVWVGKVNFLAI